MRDKVASLIQQIRKCASDLEYLAEEEELGFTAGVSQEEEKIRKRIDRIANEFDLLDIDLDLLGEEDEEVEAPEEEEKTEDSEVTAAEEDDEDKDAGEEEESENEEDEDETKEASTKEASSQFIKVACECTNCGNKEEVKMTRTELASLEADIKENKGDLFGPECDACSGELIPSEE